MAPPKVRAFLDFAQKRFGKPPYWDPDWKDDREDLSEENGSESVRQSRRVARPATIFPSFGNRARPTANYFRPKPNGDVLLD
jgi:hypothetical protein